MCSRSYFDLHGHANLANIGLRHSDTSIISQISTDLLLLPQTCVIIIHLWRTHITFLPRQQKTERSKKNSLAGSSFTRIRQPSETVQKKCSPYHLCIPNCIRIISALKYLQRCSAKTISLTTSNTSFSLRTVYIHAIIAVMITLRSSTNQSHLLSPL